MGVAYNSGSIITNGLVLCLDAANRKSYPGSGTTWTDLSGRENNFTMVGTLSYSNGIFTSTASTANYFIRNPFSHPTTAVTIEMWCLANVGSSNDAFWSYAISGADNHQLLFNQSNVALYGPSNATNVSSGINVADGNWKQIVRTSNRSNGAEVLYINGVSSFTTTMNSGTNFTSGGSLILGQEQDAVAGGLDATQALEGKYAIFRMYNRVLTAQEIQQNFNATKSRFL
jgi:hypothetical protein